MILIELRIEGQRKKTVSFGGRCIAECQRGRQHQLSGAEDANPAGTLGEIDPAVRRNGQIGDFLEAVGDDGRLELDAVRSRQLQRRSRRRGRRLNDEYQKIGGASAFQPRAGVIDV